MSDKAVAAIVLAAGQGTRMRSRLPKVLHPLAGKGMIFHVFDQLEKVGVDQAIIVIGPNMDVLEQAALPRRSVVQKEQLGTAHATLQAKDALAAFKQGTILVLFGDTPLITAETLQRMIDRRNMPDHPDIVVLGFLNEAENRYGRLEMRNERVFRIVEYKDASEDQRRNPLCNSGVMAVDAALLFPLLERVSNKNAAGEYYLTDIVALATQEQRLCVACLGDEEEVLGINSREELARAESLVQKKLRREVFAAGASMIDPESVWFSWDTKIGMDVNIGPHVVFGPGVVIEDDVQILPFCHIEGAKVKKGSRIGPYARLRPGAAIGEDAHIGNFVEIKKSIVGDGAKINHLSYVGDAMIGAKVNIGAGVITCNYDGFEKHFTFVGEGAFVGSNASLVAPVSIGAGALIGAGSVITHDVEDGALALERSNQKEFVGWAHQFRASKKSKA